MNRISLRRRVGTLGRGLGCVAVAGVAAPAQAGQVRFSETRRGMIVQAGNTLGLSKALDDNGPGTEDSIGTFISLDPASQDLLPAPLAASWPLGTTSDWSVNGSTGTLSIPFSDVANQVVYAELIWGGSYLYGSEDVTASLDTPVTLTRGANSISVTPDSLTAVTLAETSGSGSMFPVNYYIRTADVTAFVAGNGGGTYSVSGVPATQDYLIDSLNAAGWTLVVVIGNASMPVRNLSVFVGGSFVDESSVEDYPISGFCTPPSGAVQGRAFISALEGDADLTGDQATIAPTTAGPFATLDGPNNPVTNFFASQVNGSSGTLDTTGSFGTVNHDAALGSNVSGGRQGWDVTVVDLSSSAGQLSNDQTDAVLRAITTGDSFLPTTVSLEIDINAPNFTSAGAVTLDHDVVYEGDSVTMTVLVDNTGTADANGIDFFAPLPAGLNVSGFAIDGTPGDSGGAPVATADLTSGVSIGTVAAGTSKTLTVDLDIVALPTSPAAAEFRIQPSWGYDFVECSGGSATQDTFVLPEAVLTMPRFDITLSGAVQASDVVRWTAVVVNDGTADATASTLDVPIPVGTTYVANSTTLNGSSIPDSGGTSLYVGGGAINTPGDPLGTMSAGGTATVTYDVQTPGFGIISATATADQDGTGPAPGVVDQAQVDLGTAGDGDGDGDGTTGDGDGTTGDGDGTTGDGDGSTGDGDGSTGDGDGTTGDGDGTTGDGTTGDGDGSTGDGDGDATTGDGDGADESMGSSGEGDSASGTDGGGSDTSSASGGFDDGGNMPMTDGCGCQTADESPGWAGLGVFALLGLRRRRRERRRDVSR
jgi:MYXO-CTERM domain-containing protein/uncharacterized repeat protein (TIGR01451 family)